MSAQLKTVTPEPLVSGSATVNRPSIYNRTNIIAALILVSSIIWLMNWFYQRSGHVYVDDARVASTMVAVSSKVSGWIDELPVSEGQSVEKGTILARIDHREAKLQLDELEARLQTIAAEYEQIESQKRLVLDQTNTRIEAQKSNLTAAQSALSEADVSLVKAEMDWKRAQSLFEEQIISREIWEDRKANYDRARQKRNRVEAEVSISSAALMEAQANLTQIDVLTNKQSMIDGHRMEVSSKRDQLLLNLDDHLVKSSEQGVIDETFVNAGEFVSRGQRILVMHDPRDIWIKANVKETEVRRLKTGAAARIHVDAYPDMDFQGTVTRIGNAATSQFALLPSPNPSGNFTKITQRVEVRVSVEQFDDLLKPGMMVELEIVSD
jgi:membrane fusion protein (multidrug efflux system)